MAFHSAAFPEVHCAIAMHPSMKMESFHGGSSSDVYKAIGCPTMCLAASDDPEEVKPSGALSQALAERGINAHMEEYADMKHGWVPRGETSDAAVAQAVFRATHQAVGFLKQTLFS